MSDSRALPDLPSSWTWALARELCAKIQDGTHFSPKNQSREGTYRYITAKNVRPSGLDLSDVTFIEESDHRAIYTRCDPKLGDVLLVKDGVNTGDAAVNTLHEEISLLSSVCMLRPNIAVLDAKFLRYFLLSPTGYQFLTGQMTGTAIKRIVLHRIKDTPVPHAPLPEQHRIVAAIEEQFTRLDAAVAGLEQARAKLKRYRAAVLAAACSGRLVCDPAEQARPVLRDDRYPDGQGIEHPSDDEHSAGFLPEGWTLPRLGALLSEPLRNGHSAKATGNDRGIRTLTLTAVTNGDFSERNTKLTSADPNRVKSLWIEPGDIFIERSNTPELVGTARLYRGPSNFAIFPDLLIRVRVAKTISPLYAEIVLRSHKAKRFFRSRAQGIAGSMPKIDQTTVEKLSVPLPPLAEQHRIVAEVERRLSIVDELEATVAANLKRAERMRQAILRRAFAGQLVPQDPTDEPASALLQRIREERSSR